MPDSITEAQGWDEVSRTRTPALDKLAGQHVYQVRVIDLDPALEGRSREIVVRSHLTGHRSLRPHSIRTGSVRRVTVTPYVDSGRCQGNGRCNARMAFSLRATGLKAARPVAKDVA